VGRLKVPIEMNKPIVTRILFCIIGVIFLVSGLAKVIDSEGFIESLFQFGLGNLSFIAPILSPVEILLGLGLLLHYQIKTISWIVFWLTILFTFVYLYGFWVHKVEDCGCFGDWIELSPLQTLLKNGFILLGSIYSILHAKNYWADHRLPNTILGIIGALSFSLSGYTIQNSLTTTINLGNLVGQDINQTSLAHFTSKIKEEQYALFVFSPSCVHCWNSTENVKRIQQAGLAGPVYGIVGKNRATNISFYQKKMKPNFQIKIVPDNQIKENFGNRVPKLLLVNKGIIKKVYERAEIPSLPILEIELDVLKNKPKTD